MNRPTFATGDGYFYPSGTARWQDPDSQGIFMVGIKVSVPPDVPVAWVDRSHYGGQLFIPSPGGHFFMDLNREWRRYFEEEGK